MNLDQRALAFAKERHKDQTRKYNKEPYINHCIAVAELVKESFLWSEEMVAAAYLHDVIEDTNTTKEELEKEFGNEVASLVDMLTNVSTLKDGCREIRKAIERHHISRACDDAKTIKLADIIDNVPDIVKNDPVFAKTYIREKIDMLNVLWDGDAYLYNITDSLLNAYSRVLNHYEKGLADANI